MDIVVSGANGLIGSALVKSLIQDGHNVKSLSRDEKADSKYAIYWDPKNGKLKPERLNGVDAVIHLAGESIAGKNPIQGRWTKTRKEEILQSRVKGTKLLSDTLAGLSNPPKVFICASAIGYYGDRADEKLDENSTRGKGFLADVCDEWEKATSESVKKGLRVVNTRFGVILSRDGGALKSMLPPFKMGVGGQIGSGKQYMSWIDIDDVVGAIKFAIKNDSLQGIVNVVSPNPLPNIEFTKILGHVIHRPTIFPIPAIGINTLFGEMGNELLLASQRVYPKKLLDAGYQFKYSNLSSSMQHVLG